MDHQPLAAVSRLNAWLTMQLRFMAFSRAGSPDRQGRAGCTGYRTGSGPGASSGQDQLIGFSADLVYSVTRTETFAPYLFGREQLFKDKVEQGSGILVIEEDSPSAGRAAGEVRRRARRGARRRHEGLRIVAATVT